MRYQERRESENRGKSGAFCGERGEGGKTRENSARKKACCKNAAENLSRCRASLKIGAESICD